MGSILSVTDLKENYSPHSHVPGGSLWRISMKIALPLTALYIFLLLLMGVSTASAQLSVTALPGAPVFDSLTTGGVMTASQISRGVRVQDMTVAEANNFCVSNLLAKNYGEAVSACEIALQKLSEWESPAGGRRRREAEASILSNLSVGTLLRGDISAARDYADRANSLNPNDRNLRNNIRALIAESRSVS